MMIMKKKIYKKVKEMINDNNTSILDEIKNLKCDCKCNNKNENIKEKYENKVDDEDDEDENKDDNEDENKNKKNRTNKMNNMNKRRKIYSDVMINTKTGKRRNRKNKLLIDSIIFDENIPEAYYHYYYKPDNNKNDLKIGYNYNEFITKQKPFDMSNDDLSNDVVDKKDEVEGSNEIDIFEED